MREFCAKYFSCQALRERIQTLVRKKNGANDIDSEDTSTKPKSEPVKSMTSKIKQRLNNFLGGYRDFLFLGEGIQWAVAFILGGAFLNLIDDFTSGFITPWLGVIFGQTDFTALSFTINGSKFPYGKFIDTLLTFLIMTLILYFAVVLPSKWLTEKFVKKEESSQTTCLYCYSIISRKATRCPNCTSSLDPEPELTDSENIDINHLPSDERRMINNTESNS